MAMAKRMRTDDECSASARRLCTRADAFYQVSCVYADGEGASEDMARSWELFQYAADAGLVDAAYLLGKMFRNGTGSSLDLGKAPELFQIAADAGHADAVYRF